MDTRSTSVFFFFFLISNLDQKSGEVIFYLYRDFEGSTTLTLRQSRGLTISHYNLLLFRCELNSKTFRSIGVIVRGLDELEDQLED